MTPKGPLLSLAIGAALVGNAPVEKAGEEPEMCAVEIVVLGAGQDAGAPQIGNGDDEGAQLLPSSLGVIDRVSGARFLFDASPAITQQLAMLDEIAPPQTDGAADQPGANLGIDGVVLTHAHIGHYLGLAYLGFEAANTRRVPVYTMPRMGAFLRDNAPWSQLVAFDNIKIQEVEDGALIQLSGQLGFSPITVPHRDELSETVGLVILTPLNAALYVPDIDSWDEWDAANEGTLEVLIENVDYAFVDATFWDDNELLDENGVGRDMSAIPHPRVSAVMDRLQDLPASERAKIHFIHYNHTNPIRDPDSAESREVAERGFNVARRGDRHCLVSTD